MFKENEWNLEKAGNTNLKIANIYRLYLESIVLDIKSVQKFQNGAN